METPVAGGIVTFTITPALRNLRETAVSIADNGLATIVLANQPSMASSLHRVTASARGAGASSVSVPFSNSM